MAHPRTVTVAFASSALSPAARQAVAAACGLAMPERFEIACSFAATTTVSGEAAGKLAKAAAGTSAAVAFSPNEMRKFLDGIGDRTRELLVAIAREPKHRFNVGHVLDRMTWKESDLKGPLAGITKRTRTVAGDKAAQFFVSVVWNDDVDKTISEIHPLTHASMRELLLEV
jgi:hypothetical protein